MKNYSFIVPAYNESATIVKVCDQIKEVAQNLSNINEFEIIVVDDNSHDNTFTKLKNLNYVKVLQNLNNFGYGFCLKKGIRTSKYENIIILDGDGTYPISYLSNLLKEYEKGYDLVVGKRTGKNLNLTFYKKPLRNILKFIVEFSTGEKIQDINSGYRVIKKECILKNLDILSNAFSFTTSMTMTFIYSRFSISYVDVPYNLRDAESKSKVRLLRDSLRTLQYIIKIILFFDKIKLFVLLSFLTFILSLVFLILFLIFDQIFLNSSVNLLITSIIIFAIGMLSESRKN